MPFLGRKGRGKITLAHTVLKCGTRQTVKFLQVFQNALIVPYLPFADIYFPKERDLIFIGMQ